MKKTITLVTLFLCSFYVSRAQSYIPFPTANALWTERDGQGQDSYPTYLAYGMKQGDTTIGTVTYHKLYKSSDDVFSESEYCGGLREDSKRIYFYNAGNGTERMLYDFNLTIGDTVREWGPGAIVASLDSVLISGTYHKRFNFRSIGSATIWPYGSWIEGIGNSGVGALLGHVMALPTCDCGVTLLCFKTSSDDIFHSQFYSNTNGADCFGPVLGIEEPMNSKPLNYIVPNPVQDISRLNNTEGFKKMTIYSVTGAVVATTDLSQQQSITISKKDYAAGMYYYRLDNGRTGSVTGKFIVQ